METKYAKPIKYRTKSKVIREGRTKRCSIDGVIPFCICTPGHKPEIITRDEERINEIESEGTER